MRKDYQHWTPLKQNLNNAGDKPFYHERQIWRSYLGENIGFEQDGRGKKFLRPIIILKKFNNHVFWGIPLTRTLKNMPFYFNFTITDSIDTFPKESSAILSQIRLMDACRLSDRIGYISRAEFDELKLKLKALLP